MLPIFLSLVLKIETKIPLPNTFCEVNTTFILKPDKNIPREAYYRQIFLMNFSA